MAGIVEYLVRRALLADGAGVEHDDFVAHLGHHAQIVGDHDDGHAQLFLEGFHQLQNLGLDGHVQSGGGFVGDEDIGLAGQGHGDHHALAHAAGKLEGVLLHALFRLVDVDQAQHLHRPVPGLLFIAIGMQGDGLDQLMAYGIGGIQRGHGVLEDDGYLVAADGLHHLFPGAHQLLTVQLDGAADDLAGGGQYLHDGIGGDGFAGAGFAHDAQDFAALEIEGNAVDRSHLAGGGEKGGMQISYF